MIKEDGRGKERRGKEEQRETVRKEGGERRWERKGWNKHKDTTTEENAMRGRRRGR